MESPFHGNDRVSSRLDWLTHNILSIAHMPVESAYASQVWNGPAHLSNPRAHAE